MPSVIRSVCLSTALVACAGLGLVRSASAAVQDPPPPGVQQAPSADAGEQSPPAGFVSTVDGVARLDRDGEESDVERGVPLVEGDRIRTDAGRIEITLSDGTLLHLDRFSEIDVIADQVIRLGRGRLLVTINGARSGERLAVETPGALARVDPDGQYRVTVGGDDEVEVELAVLRGSAELENDGGALRIGTGQTSRVHDGSAPTRGGSLTASAATALERWADELLTANWQGTQPSQTYLPEELDAYAGTFDRYGSWQTDATYGSVWYPTVAVDWRPYYNGRWDHMRRYGWTWVASDPWGYPTHHYGRWQLSVRGSWFWVPSRQWGPAWVYWATTPTYVGWCPLGWNGRPVLSVFNYGGPSRSYSRWRDPYRAWTVLPTHSFGRVHVQRARVDRTVLDRDRPTFVMQHVAPGFAPTRRPTSQRADRDGGAPTRRPGGYVAPYGRGDDGNRSSSGTTYNRAPRTGDYRTRQQTPAPNGDDRRRDGDDGRDDARSPNGATYRRAPQSPDAGSRGGWSNYREYERRTQEQRNRERDRAGDGDRSGDRAPTRSPGAYTRPTDPGPRPDSSRGYTPPPDTGRGADRGDGRGADRGGSAQPRGGDRGGDRGGSAGRPSGGSSGGGNDARRGGDSGGSRGGDSGSRGGAAPRRRP
jgi:hypothetical protein